jgi:hypothetical protein
VSEGDDADRWTANRPIADIVATATVMSSFIEGTRCQPIYDAARTSTMIFVAHGADP